MKRTFTLIAIMLLTLSVIAQDFVMINVDNQQQTEKLFNDNNLKIHYFNDNFVLATAKVVDKTMQVLDNQAFENTDAYYIVYCDKANQDNYIADIDNANVLFKNNNILIVNNFVKPFKNDGMIAVFNKEAKMAVRNRDFPVVTEENPVIREMMNQVSMDSLEATVQHLQDYQNRMWDSQNAFDASDWIAGRMAALGLEVEQQPFYASTWTGSGQAAPNVIGIQRGTLYPDVYVVCGSHFDSFSYEAMYGGGTCPGADDNATGVASVLESARIMTQYEFEYSIIYCAYGCEEMGLYGSEAYAARCQQEGMEILGYFNNDMNGYLYGDQIHIDCIYPNSVAPIGDYYMNVGSVYFPELPIRHVNFNEGDSDHTSFNNHGYMGIYPFEDYQHYSPNIHTPNDLIGPSVTSFEMSQRYCQMNIGCLAELANPAGEPQIYCNPVSNFVLTDWFDKETSHLVLEWEDPAEGSSGDIEYFDIYRDNEVIATVQYGNYYTIGVVGEYKYLDTITVDVHAFYYINAIYSDGCEAPSEILEGVGHPDGISEIETSDIVAFEIYDILGRPVLRQKGVWKNVEEIRVTDLESGIYMMRIFTQNGNVVTKKFIKK
ncbi:MAG: M28 family peptidase [Bacteroidales bacterium]|nr:M28 family peptidase [Bacteroidales bacterium]